MRVLRRSNPCAAHTQDWSRSGARATVHQERQTQVHEHRESCLMRRASDDKLRTLLRRGLPPPLFDWQSVETGGTGGGVPDANFCSRGVEGWIECKATDGWAVTIRPAQCGWILRRRRAGGRVLIAVRQRHDGGPIRGLPVDWLYVLSGDVVRELKTGGLLHPAVVAGTLGRWRGGPSKWDWTAVGRVLIGEANP